MMPCNEVQIFFLINFSFVFHPDNVSNIPVELGFLFDSSGQISPSDFRAQVDIAKQIVDSFNISEDLARVGAAVFSDNARVLFNFSDPIYGPNNTAREVKQLLDKLPHDQGAAKLSDGLVSVATELFTPKYGNGSQGTPQVSDTLLKSYSVVWSCTIILRLT